MLRSGFSCVKAPAVLALLILLCAGSCSAYTPGDPEYRAFWIDAWGDGLLNQSQVDKLLGVPGDPNSKGDIRNANCNMVFVQVRRRADVCYPSGMGEPYFSMLSPADFNALQAITNAAHDTTGGKQRIEVHCWIVAFACTTDGGTPGPVYYAHNDPADPDNYWMTRDNAGAETGDKAMDPGHPKFEEYLTDVCMDLVNRFDIDGIHYDYIRFTANNQGYNPTSIARYNARYGLTGQPDPANEQFKQWRRDQVTALVRRIYAKIQTSKPWVKQSGSFVTWNPSPTSSTRSAFQATRPYYDVYSDWDSWMQEGIVDMGVPMTYYDNASLPADYLRWINFEKDRKFNRHMIIGPGIYLNYLDEAITQLQMTRDASPAGNYADGFSGYSYRSPYSTVKSPRTYGTWDNFAPSLLSQVTSTSAAVPDMPWKSHPTKGHISGTITECGGAWVDGATVSITGPENRTQICDGTGFYAFIDLTPGAYTVTVSRPGYADLQSVVDVAIGVVTGNMYVTDFSYGGADTPPTITDVVSSGVSHNGAVITWITDQASTSQVEYGTTSSYGQTTAESTTLVTNHSVVLTGLAPNTTYHFRVKSTNCASLTSFSGDFTLTTIDLPTEIIVDDNDAEYPKGTWTVSTAYGGYNGGYHYVENARSSTTASCDWRPNILIPGAYDVYCTYISGSNRTTAAKYTLYYSGGASVSATFNQQANGGTWNLIASGVQMDAGTSGYVRLINKTGESSGSKVVIADAIKFVYVGGDATPPSVPSGLAATAASTSQINLTWNPSIDNTGVAGYKVFRGGQLVGNAAATSFSDAGLTANTQYTYSVSAYDAENNESALSSSLARYTLSTPPAGVVICSREAGQWYGTPSFVFGNPGFGSGKVGSYRCVWDNSLTHTWNESEATWTSTFKTVDAASTTQPWYFHVKGYNSEGIANGVADLGPYNYGLVFTTIAAAANHPDGTGIIIDADEVVSAIYDGFCYIQEPTRTRGLRVNLSTSYSAGEKLRVGGRLNQSADERLLLDASVISTLGGVAPLPLGMNIAAIGGVAPDAFTLSVAGAKGPFNFGLLIRVAGKVTSTGAGYFILDDASGATAKVYSTKAITGTLFVGATGICCLEGGERVIRTRTEDDVQIYAP